MAVLRQEYEPFKMASALDMLLVDRRNEFKTLEEAVFWNVRDKPVYKWEEFILNFCLDVSQAFKSWSGISELEANSDMKALTFLRQLSHDKTMTELCHLLNLAYTLAEEFKVIYHRI